MLVWDLSAWQACLLSSTFSILFVASLYVWALCKYDVSNRNDTLVIKQRIISVTFVCIICPIIITLNCHLLQSNGKIVNNPLMILASYQYWKEIGCNFDNIHESLFYTLILMILWWLGPLVEDPYHFHKLPQKQYATPIMIIRGKYITFRHIPFSVYYPCTHSIMLI